jgi:hypothetical protein
MSKDGDHLVGVVGKRNGWWMMEEKQDDVILCRRRRGSRFWCKYTSCQRREKGRSRGGG